MIVTRHRAFRYFKKNPQKTAQLNRKPARAWLLISGSRNVRYIYPGGLPIYFGRFLYILEFFKIFFVTGKFSYGLVDVALLTFLQTFANKIGPKWNHFETFINLIKILPRNVLPLLKYNYLKS